MERQAKFEREREARERAERAERERRDDDEESKPESRLIGRRRRIHEERGSRLVPDVKERRLQMMK
jgi:hypothetical protein